MGSRGGLPTASGGESNPCQDEVSEARVDRPDIMYATKRSLPSDGEANPRSLEKAKEVGKVPSREAESDSEIQVPTQGEQG